MKVYVILFSSYEPYPDDGGCYENIEGVVSTEELAKSYVDKLMEKLKKEHESDIIRGWVINEDGALTNGYTELCYYYEEYELDKIEDMEA